MRFQRTVYDKNSTLSTLLDNKIATMGFVYQDNLEMSDSLRVENPLGFRVTDYRVDNDYSSLPAAPATGAVINAQPQAAAQQPGIGVVDPNAANVSGAIPQGGVPLQQGALPQGACRNSKHSPRFRIKCSRRVSLRFNPKGRRIMSMEQAVDETF